MISEFGLRGVLESECRNDKQKHESVKRQPEIQITILSSHLRPDSIERLIFRYIFSLPCVVVFAVDSCVHF